MEKGFCDVLYALVFINTCTLLYSDVHVAAKHRQTIFSTYFNEHIYTVCMYIYVRFRE